MDDWKDLFCNDWFVKLQDYGNRWGIAHKSFDGKTVAEIIDKDLNRLIETWERLFDELKAAKDD